MAILVTDGVGEGNLGMVATFYHHNQAKVEASQALSFLHQHDSLEPSVVVVRRYTNSPYVPQGFFSFLYLDMTTLSGGHLICPIPTGLTTPTQITPLLQHQGGPATGGGRWRAKGISLLLGGLIAKLWGGALPFRHHAPIDPLVIPSSPLRRGLPDRGRIGFLPIPQVVARCQPGKSPARMWVSSGSTGVS